MEGTSWYLALREFSASKGRMRWWPAIRHSKDPANFIVQFEGSAALAGLVVAAIGVWTSDYFNDARLDGIASNIIVSILALVATMPARESKGLRSEKHEQELQTTRHNANPVFQLTHRQDAKNKTLY